MPISVTVLCLPLAEPYYPGIESLGCNHRLVKLGTVAINPNYFWWSNGLAATRTATRSELWWRAWVLNLFIRIGNSVIVNESWLLGFVHCICGSCLCRSPCLWHWTLNLSGVGPWRSQNWTLVELERLWTRPEAGHQDATEHRQELAKSRGASLVLQWLLYWVGIICLKRSFKSRFAFAACGL